MGYWDEMEEAEYRFGPKLWDATPGVCCAAFQLGACEHTEAWSEDELDELDELPVVVEVPVVVVEDDEPF